MTYSSKLDPCVCAGILLVVAAVFVGATYWICAPVLLVLLLCAYPKSYRTGPLALVVHEPLATRQIPYAAITSAAPEDGRIRLRFGLASQLLLAPTDPHAFLADVAGHTPHLVRRGDQLLLRDRHVEYSFTKPRRAYGVGPAGGR
jgi:hypothetical protein